MRSEAHEVLAPVPAAIAHARETPPAAVPEPAAIAAAEPARVEPARPPRPDPVVAAAPKLIAELPPVTLSLPPDSGLVLVETSHPAALAPKPEPELPAGPRRARRSRTQLADEPLQIIETRKDQPPAG